jgi:osmotically-inducible protein OsmY
MTTADACAEIRAELPYSHRMIRVAGNGPRVTLSGEVEWPYQKQRAEAAVRRVRGVQDVRNLISLQPRAAAQDVQRRMQDSFRRTPGSVRAWAERRGA